MENTLARQWQECLSCGHGTIFPRALRPLEAQAQRSVLDIVTISDESLSLYHFFSLSHKIISPEDVQGRLCHVHFLTSQASIHGYTKEDTYGNRHPGPRLV